MPGPTDKISNPVGEFVGTPAPTADWQQAADKAATAPKPASCEEKAASTYMQCSSQAYKYEFRPTGMGDSNYSFVPTTD